MADVVVGEWSEGSAFNIDAALAESRRWIEEVTSTKFPSNDFQISCKDGILLCILVNQIKPGVTAAKWHRTNLNDFKMKENISLFSGACKKLGLKDSQIFANESLSDGKRLRDVAICLYWLGRAARATPSYHGPQLDISKFGSKLSCAKCRQLIEEKDPVVTLNKAWHKACAKCDSCSCQIDPKQGYAESADKNSLLCMPCYNKKASDNCSTCGNPLNGSKLKDKKGKPICGNCTCFDCFIPLVDGYYDIDNHRYCEPCSKNHLHDDGDHCAACHKALSGEVAEVDGKQYCVTCVCDACDAPLDPKTAVTVKNAKGKDVRVCPDCVCAAGNHVLSAGDPFIKTADGQKVCKKCADAGKKPPAAAAAGTATKKCLADGCSKQIPANTDPGFCPAHSTCQSKSPLCKEKVPKGATVPFCDKHNPDHAGHGHHGHGHSHAHPHGNKCQHDNCDDDAMPALMPLNPKGLKYCEPHIKDHACANPKCGKDLKDGPSGGAAVPVVAVGDKKFHQPCFSCGSCGTNFKGGEKVHIGKNDGVPLCDPCSKKGVKCCATCAAPVTKDGVEAFDKIFHDSPECFKCFKCSAGLGDEYFDIQGVGPACAQCAKGAEEPCGFCSKPLSGQVTELFDFKYHLGCVKCLRCKKDLVKSYFPHRSKPHCLDCVRILNKDTKCDGVCGEYLLGQCVSTNGKNFCDKPACFACVKCKKALPRDGKLFRVKFGALYCLDDWAKHYPAEKSKTPEAITREFHTSDKVTGFTIDKDGNKVMRK